MCYVIQESEGRERYPLASGVRFPATLTKGSASGGNGGEFPPKILSSPWFLKRSKNGGGPFPYRVLKLRAEFY